MKNKVLMLVKKDTIIAVLTLLLSAVLMSSILFYFQIQLQHSVEIEKRDKTIRLKDSLYLQCNGEINKINADPIYQFYVRNDLTFSE